MPRRARIRHAAGGLLALTLTVAIPAAAQTPPPPCPKAVKGRVVSLDPTTRIVTLERGPRQDALPIAERALARLRDLKPGDQVTLDMDCSVKPPQVVGVTVGARPTPTPGPPRPGQTPDARSTTVLLATEQACTLKVDFKPWGELKAGARTELKLTSGDEHQLEATTADGRSWKEKIKASGGQIIVETKFGKPVATVAEYDAQASEVCGALAALKAAGQALDAILRDKKYKFHNADSSAVSGAVASWARELALLKELVAPSEREQATTDLTSIDASVREYADLLVKGLETAQEKNTVMGEASTMRAKAQALAPLLRVPAATAKLLPSCAAASAP
jgi:hypothetical protein